MPVCEVFHLSGFSLEVRFCSLFRLGKPDGPTDKEGPLNHSSRQDVDLGDLGVVWYVEDVSCWDVGASFSKTL